MTNFTILRIVFASLAKGILWVMVLPWLGFIVVASELLKKLLLMLSRSQCAKLD